MGQPSLTGEWRMNARISTIRTLAWLALLTCIIDSAFSYDEGHESDYVNLFRHDERYNARAEGGTIHSRVVSENEPEPSVDAEMEPPPSASPSPSPSSSTEPSASATPSASPQPARAVRAAFEPGADTLSSGPHINTTHLAQQSSNATADSDPPAPTSPIAGLQPPEPTPEDRGEPNDLLALPPDGMGDDLAHHNGGNANAAEPAAARQQSLVADTTKSPKQAAASVERPPANLSTILDKQSTVRPGHVPTTGGSTDLAPSVLPEPPPEPVSRSERGEDEHGVDAMNEMGAVKTELQRDEPQSTPEDRGEPNDLLAMSPEEIASLEEAQTRPSPSLSPSSSPTPAASPVASSTTAGKDGQFGQSQTSSALASSPPKVSDSIQIDASSSAKATNRENRRENPNPPPQTGAQRSRMSSIPEEQTRQVQVQTRPRIGKNTVDSISAQTIRPQGQHSTLLSTTRQERNVMSEAYYAQPRLMQGDGNAKAMVGEAPSVSKALNQSLRPDEKQFGPISGQRAFLPNLYNQPERAQHMQQLDADMEHLHALDDLQDLQDDDAAPDAQALDANWLYPGSMYRARAEFRSVPTLPYILQMDRGLSSGSTPGSGMGELTLRGSFIDSSEPTYIKHFSAGYELDEPSAEIANLLVNIIAQRDIHSLLDVPCRAHLRWMNVVVQHVMRLDPTFEYTCIDSSRTIIRQANRLLSRTVRTRFVRSRFWVAPLPAADLVFAWGGIDRMQTSSVASFLQNVISSRNHKYLIIKLLGSTKILGD